MTQVVQGVGFPAVVEEKRLIGGNSIMDVRHVTQVARFQILPSSTDLGLSFSLENLPTMHSVYARISNVSAFMSSCLMALLATIALSSFIFTADPKGDLSIASVKVSVALYQFVRCLGTIFPSYGL